VQRDAVVAADSVVIVPLADRRQIVMIRNERFIAGQSLWELPAGTLEAGEQPAACAARELIEETGYRAGELHALTQFYPSPGLCTEFMHAFVARDLEQVGQNLDENERIEVEIVTWRRALQMMRDGTIRDGKTLAALLFYRTFAGR
jgi:ADP-ribose pyrophosphatase